MPQQNNNRLRCDSAFESCENIAVNESSSIVTLLNTRSLENMPLTLLKNLALWKVIFCMSYRNQIRIDHDTFNIKRSLNGFDIFFNNSREQTFPNLVICLHKNLSLVSTISYWVFLFLII